MKKYNWEEISLFYKSHSRAETVVEFGMAYETFSKASRRGDIKTRSREEGIELAKKRGKTSARINSIHSEESKQKISKSMKKAHSEGRAHNIGESRWNNEPSYPEIFFMNVIANEFIDKEYKREHPFGKFSIDFAWIGKKKAIEIDGEQHERCEEQKRRDKEKDKLLLENGWQILRIKWKDMYNDPKLWIKIAKEFI